MDPITSPELRFILTAAGEAASREKVPLSEWHVLKAILGRPESSVVSAIEESSSPGIIAKLLKILPKYKKLAAPGNQKLAISVASYTQEITEFPPSTSLFAVLIDLCVRRAASDDRGNIGASDLLSVLIENYPEIKAFLGSNGVQVDLLLAKINDPIVPTDEDEVYNVQPTRTIDKFSVDLTKEAREGRLDPVIGRDAEVARVIQTLVRRRKNNPVLVGEPGVGKTAIVEGLAIRIAEGQVPDLLKDRSVLALDMSAVIAGTQFRGQFEERIRAILNEVESSPEIILFIDEIHNIVGSGSAQGSMDGSNILKAPLSRGKLSCIGATTVDEYQRLFEKDGALERRFQKIMVEPPTTAETIDIIKGLKDTYGEFHGVSVSDELVEHIVTLTDIHIGDKCQPDKSIDVLDESCAFLKLAAAEDKPAELKALELDVTKWRNAKELAVRAEVFDAAALAKHHLAEAETQLRVQTSKWRKSLRTARHQLNEETILKVFSRLTGLPLAKMEQSDIQKLSSLDTQLAKRVIGQDAAIASLVASVKRSRTGWKKKNRPVGVFIFLGPTGVGKTQLAKELAVQLFGDERFLIRQNMSELQDRHSGSRLTGAPPGYVGYEEGGSLVNKIRARPHSVVLLDEIEKASPSIYDLLLQVFDDGQLEDGKGKKADLRHTIFIMTSNIGGELISGEEKSIGLVTETDTTRQHKELAESLKKRLKDHFKPEFLNRVDDIIVFGDLSKDQLSQIVPILLSELNNNSKVKVDVTPEACLKLVDLAYEPNQGARPLDRAIQEHITSKIADAMIAGDIQDGDTCTVCLNGGEFVARKNQGGTTESNSGTESTEQNSQAKRKTRKYTKVTRTN